MTESFTNVKEGAITKGAIVESFIAAGLIPMWSPVVTAAAGTNENLPRVQTTTTAGDTTHIGVAVGPKRSTGNAADSAGQSVDVVVFGICKCTVDGSSDNIAIADMLQTKSAAGVAIKCDHFAEIGRAHV